MSINRLELLSNYFASKKNDMPVTAGDMLNVLRDLEAFALESQNPTVENITVNNAAFVSGSVITPFVSSTERITLSKEDANGNIGKLTLKVDSITQALSGASVDFEFEIPVGCALVMAQYIFNEAVVYAGGGVSTDIVYTGGNVTTIAGALVGTLGESGDIMFDVNASSNIVTSSVCNVQLAPDTGTFDGGNVTINVYYWSPEPIV